MSRVAAVKVPLTPEQRKLILDATGQDVTETIVVGDTDQQKLQGEVTGELDRALADFLGKKNPAFDRLVAHSYAQKAQPNGWRTTDEKNPSLILIR